MLRSVSSWHRDHGRQRGILQRADGFIAEGRNHRADRLRRDHPPHQQHRRHAERLAGQHLPAVDAEHAGAKHFGDEGRFVAGQRQTGCADRAAV